MSFTRNGNQMFGIGIEPGEAQCILQFMKFILNKIYSERHESDMNKINNPEQSKYVEDEPTQEAPF